MFAVLLTKYTAVSCYLLNELQLQILLFAKGPTSVSFVYFGARIVALWLELDFHLSVNWVHMFNKLVQMKQAIYINTCFLLVSMLKVLYLITILSLYIL